MANGQRIAVMVARLGPYHVARLQALGARFGEEAVCALEMSSATTEYAWEPVEARGFRRVTLFEDVPYEGIAREALRTRLLAALDAEKPQTLAVNGWGFFESRVALSWCQSRRVPSVLMSDSTERDSQRGRVREWAKGHLVRCADAAFVAGSRHAAYLEKLGFAEDRIVRGYDVVDNAYFAAQTEAARRSPPPEGLGRPYFLVVARFVPKKNLLRLLDAFAAYKARAGVRAWDCALVGDGPLSDALHDRVRALRLEGAVHFSGFRQYGELPAWFAHASALVLPSTSEQWGLVVNEAMAAGLPVAVSDACGCAEDLVKDNGVVFDPLDEHSIANALHLLAHESPLEQWGRRSRELIASYSPQSFAAAMEEACAKAAARSGRCSKVASMLLRI